MKRISLFRRLLLATMICASATVSAQVAIGTAQPPNATLQVVGTPSDQTPAGVIAPNVTVANLNASAANYGTAQTGAIVYVTDAAGASAATKTGNITSAGYYYFDGVADVWKGLGGGTVSFQQLRGNVVTVTTPTYTIQPNDWAVVTKYSANVTITFPDMTVADIGRTVLIYNDNTVATGNTWLDAAGNPLLGNPTNNINRGGTVMWTGTRWGIMDK